MKCRFSGVVYTHWRQWRQIVVVGRDPVERARARETKNHPLCGWSQSVKRKNTPSSIM